MGEPRSTGMKCSCVTEDRIKEEQVNIMFHLESNTRILTRVHLFYAIFTSFQQTDAHGGDLDDVFVFTDISSKHSGALGGKTTGVQLHDLLTCLKDLHKNMGLVHQHYKLQNI